MSRYLIVWKYKVKPEYKEIFEIEYGVAGAWNSLFIKSKSYKGSFLHLSEMDIDTYLLIDTWTSKALFEKFVKSSSQDYQKLSSKFEFIYESEEKIGMFTSVG